jgi:hypothetical protein
VSAGPPSPPGGLPAGNAPSRSGEAQSHPIGLELVQPVPPEGAAAPIQDVQVALGPYRAATDKAGRAHIETPAGTYDLAVWKSGFEAAPKTIEVTADLSVRVELTRLPEEVKAWG